MKSNVVAPDEGSGRSAGRSEICGCAETDVRRVNGVCEDALALLHEEVVEGTYAENLGMPIMQDVAARQGKFGGGKAFHAGTMRC